MPCHAPRLRRLILALLLPVVLLFAQQGALLHELGHFQAAAAAASASTAGPQARAPSPDADLCLDCLGFAQVAGLAHFDVPAPPALDGLADHFLAETSRSVAEASTPAPRTRGPPPSA